jgi:hypothetical protein
MHLNSIQAQAVGKLAVVGIVVMDCDTMQRGIGLKSPFGFYYLLGSCQQLQETKGELTEMVNKYCGSLVPLDGQDPSVGNSSCLWRHNRHFLSLVLMPFLFHSLP